MNSAINELRETLRSAGWIDLSTGTLQYLDLLLRRSFAVVGVLFSAEAADALQRWLPAQAELSELGQSLGRHYDLYLLICVPEIDEPTMNQLPAVIGDTHVCRKLVVELRGRPLDEALLDVPLIVWRTPDSGPDDLDYAPLPESTISPVLLDDLGRKSPARVLDAWLEGQYGRPKQDAD